MARVTKHPGNPGLYTPKIGEEILTLTRQGRTLKQISKLPGMPHEATMRLWAANVNDPFSHAYMRAKELGILSWVDDIIDFADQEDKDPRRSALQIETRKWLASKALPKMFGDRSKHDVEGDFKIEIVGGLPSAVKD